MKKQITILLISVVALLASYSFLSCGFDSRLGLNFACPASLTVLFNQNTTVDQPISSAISPGTYFVYSINQAVSGAGSAWENKLLAYNQENKKTKLITTKDHFFVFQIKGNKIFASDTLSSVYGSGFVVGLDGKETPSNVDDLLNPVIESQDGNRRVLVSPWNSDASNLGCQKDGLKIQINQEGGAVIDKNFSWKDYGLNQLCPEEYYFSHNGKYFYIVGDSVGGGSVDTVMKYSVDEDKMTKIEIAENSWLNFWSLDVDNGWMAGISNGYNLGVDHRVDHRIFKINLMSGEMTDLLNPHSLLFLDKFFLSTDGNYWSPVFSDLVDGESMNCVRVLSVGDELRAKDSTQCLMSGKVVDWVGDNLVVNRDKDLVLYNFNTKVITVLAEKNTLNSDISYQAIDYLGTIKID